VKGHGVINAPPLIVLAIAWDTEKKTQWDPMLESGRIVSHLNANTSLHYECYKGQWPVTPRDYSLLCHWEKLPDGRYLCLRRSVVHPSLPEISTKVRGEHHGGFILSPLKSSTQTSVIYFESNDLKGSISHTIVRGIAPEWVNVIRSIGDIAEKLTPVERATFDLSRFSG